MTEWCSKAKEVGAVEAAEGPPEAQGGEEEALRLHDKRRRSRIPMILTMIFNTALFFFV